MKKILLALARSLEIAVMERNLGYWHNANKIMNPKAPAPEFKAACRKMGRVQARWERDDKIAHALVSMFE